MVYEKRINSDHSSSLVNHSSWDWNLWDKSKVFEENTESVYINVSVTNNRTIFTSKKRFTK